MSAAGESALQRAWYLVSDQYVLAINYYKEE